MSDECYPTALDRWLIQEAQSLADAATVHRVMNCVYAYEGTVAEYAATGDEEWGRLALEAEQALRVELVRLRQRRAAFLADRE